MCGCAVVPGRYGPKALSRFVVCSEGALGWQPVVAAGHTGGHQQQPSQRPQLQVAVCVWPVALDVVWPAGVGDQARPKGKQSFLFKNCRISV